MTTCATCDPPAPVRISESHIAVRFGDANPRWTVLLDGIDVTHDCTEALAGQDGWVAMMCTGEVCSGNHVRTEQRHGHVQIVRSARSAR